MNKETIEQRLAELNAMEQQVTQQVLKGQSDLSAINGAKQDCQFWLDKLSQGDEVPTPAKRGPKKKVA